MATIVHEIEANVESTALLTDGHGDTSDTGNSQNGSSRRTRLLAVCKLLLHLGCLGYSLYLVWLLAYLKNNNNYWYLSFISFVCNFVSPCMACYGKEYLNGNLGRIAPSLSVVLNLMICFTMLTRQAYYHRQSDEFIGPRYIIISLQGSNIFILLDFLLQREGKLDRLPDYKDALTCMFLDFVDIFNMVEILSVNDCIRVGSFVPEESSLEKAIQAFCTMSFLIIWIPLDIMTVPYLGATVHDALVEAQSDTHQQRSPMTHAEILYTGMIAASVHHQNLPFLIIRIVVWAQYKLYSLGFLMKNVTAIVIATGVMFKLRKIGDELN